MDIACSKFILMNVLWIKYINNPSNSIVDSKSTSSIYDSNILLMHILTQTVELPSEAI